MPEPASLGETLKTLLTIAWLLPLGGFIVEIFAGYWGTRQSKAAAYLAVACIVGGFLCSGSALLYWGNQTGWVALQEHGDHSAGHAEEHSEEHAAAEHKEAGHAAAEAGHQHDNAAEEHAYHGPLSFSGTHYVLAKFGSLKIAIDWYIDSLTLVMFTMVTFIASMIHLFAIGYMSDELTDDYEDHQVHTRHGHLHRPGRFYRFFAFLSLFSFSMLGLVLAGNVFMVFIFWELVGVCSYFLIGYYTERKTATNAANKAFIMNRVGDFGFLIGLMILWTWFGTFQFATRTENNVTTTGLFDMVRGADGQMSLLRTESGMTEVLLTDSNDQQLFNAETKQPRSIPYFLLVAAGLGVFAGCVGKSAQFPLQTWLPDAMEGPTPVSALVHSATMVAAGVYLAGRFYPMFTPEVLLTIAYIGCITLFLAATIAVVVTDIKQVLAYSTISQLGYMMLAIGVGGWGAGLFHLITHAFFKSLMFMASGSVIYGCHHVQEMPRMGGLIRKMPITALTMLVGVIAISGLAIPGIVAFSGYHSKDAIVATAMTYAELNAAHFLLFVFPLVGAGITAFYMFRLWFYTFAGAPRDQHVFDHAHEVPRIMWIPLVVVSLFAAFVAVGGESGPLYKLLAASEPVGVANGVDVTEFSQIALPGHAAISAHHSRAGRLALLAAALGTIVAYLFYGIRTLNPADVRRQFTSVHTFLVEKWRFDELYDVMFVRPLHIVARWCAAIDRIVFDGLLHGACKGAMVFADFDRRFDEQIVDGLVNLVSDVTFATGRSLRVVQTGQLRQYVMFIVVGVVGIWVLVSLMAA